MAIELYLKGNVYLSTHQEHKFATKTRCKAPLVVSCYFNDVTLLANFVGGVAYCILCHPMWELRAWILDRLHQWGTETDEEGVLVGKRHEPSISSDLSHMIRSVPHQQASTHISAKSCYAYRGPDWPALEIDLSAALKRFLPIRLTSFLRQHPKPCKVDRNSLRRDDCHKKNSVRRDDCQRLQSLISDGPSFPWSSFSGNQTWCAY